VAQDKDPVGERVELPVAVDVERRGRGEALREFPARVGVLPPLDQATTKSPSVSMSATAEPWFSKVYVLTWNSEP
jgi:hypothetical protein